LIERVPKKRSDYTFTGKKFFQEIKCRALPVRFTVEVELGIELSNIVELFVHILKKLLISR